MTIRAPISPTEGPTGNDKSLLAMLIIVPILFLIVPLANCQRAASVEIRLGLLLASERILDGKNYARPEAKLAYVFQHAVNKLNLASSLTIETHSNISTNRQRLIFKPIVAETYGQESASIQQTVRLIQEQRVHFLLGSREPCELEPRLASIYNVPMVEHSCATTSPGPIVQTKPPYWKIVRLALQIVESLLDGAKHGLFPDRVVLVYFKKQSPSAWSNGTSSSRSSGGREESVGSFEQENEVERQYRLIGQSLEVELTQRLKVRQQQHQPRPSSQQAKRLFGSSLAVLNWHTTFHHGLTANPFRRLIMDHLLRRRSAFSSSRGECSTVHLSATNTSGSDKAAIYVIVGHYHEHLGLLMALDELNLLVAAPKPPDQLDTNERETSDKEQPQPSVAPASLVLGLDMEPYDEQEDKDHFLKGVLADASQGAEPDTLRSMRELYRRYLAIVPVKPNRTRDFLAEIQSSLLMSNQSYLLLIKHNNNRTDDSGRTKQPLEPASGLVDQPELTHSQRVADPRFLLSRLPLEAFYLFDSVQIIGKYLQACLEQGTNSDLLSCCEGQRFYSWAKNRIYKTAVNRNELRLDESAKCEGQFGINSRRIGQFSNNEDEASVAQVGLSVAGVTQLLVNLTEVDPLWWPLWCSLIPDKQQNSTNLARDCAYLEDKLKKTLDKLNGQRVIQAMNLLDPLLVCSVALILLLIACVRLCCLRCSTGSAAIGKRGRRRLNEGWFSLMDERNFLEIINRPLIMAESPRGDNSGSNQLDRIIGSSQPKDNSVITIHCELLAMPNCMFVHWLRAMLQLKEMLFQFQTSHQQSEQAKLASQTNSSICCFKRIGAFEWRFASKTLFKAPQWARSNSVQQAAARSSDEEKKANPDNTLRGFFASQHKGTASLRLLLNKYRASNDCLCRLARLDHQAIVTLKGAALGYWPSLGGGRLAELLVETCERGNLSEALAALRVTFSTGVGWHFWRSQTRSLLENLLEGLQYLHASSFGYHGDLRPQNCLITYDWRLKLTGFQVHHLRRTLLAMGQESAQQRIARGSHSNQQQQRRRRQQLDLGQLAYTAPEVLSRSRIAGSTLADAANSDRAQPETAALSEHQLRLADLYSFAYVAYEILAGVSPWSWLCSSEPASPRLLVERVQVDSSFRPPLSRLDCGYSDNHSGPDQGDTDSTGDACTQASDQSRGAGSKVVTLAEPDSASQSGEPPATSLDLDSMRALIRSCWSHSPERRPQSVTQLQNRLQSCFGHHGQTSKTSNEQQLKLYLYTLERVSVRRKRRLLREAARNRAILYRLLPRTIGDRLSRGQRVPSQAHELTSFCSFRLCFPGPTFDSHTQPETRANVERRIQLLNDIIFQLDVLVSKFEGAIHLLDSPVDCCQRFLAYSAHHLYPNKRPNDNRPAIDHSQLMASFALQLVDLANRWPANPVKVKCALHCGPVSAGLSGCTGDNECDPLGAGHISPRPTDTRRPKLIRYILFGAPLELLDSLESTSLPQRIQISADYRLRLLHHARTPDRIQANDRPDYLMIKREAKIQAKSLGIALEVFWLLNGPRLTASQALSLSRQDDDTSSSTS